MPAFYPPSRPSAGQLPLTPPDSGSGYGYTSMHYPQETYMAHTGMHPARQESPYDYQQAYVPASTTAPSAYAYASNNYQASNNLPPISSYYEPTAGPILPPLRLEERMSFAEDYNHRVQQEHFAREHQQQRQAAKEDKATGGVSAKLDYDMERMTDFVSEAAQSIFPYALQSSPAFRKWVHQVLSATRLPSATILLSLHYLSDRVKTHPDSIVLGENQIYRLLAVALILGSKFLDDNTFINRSWSDVTAIKVTELNQLELKWLQLIHYDLHVDPYARDGLQAWIDAWKDYDAKYVAKRQTARLSPLNTSVHRNAATLDHRYSPYPSPYSSTSSHSYNTPLTSRSSQYSTAFYNAANPWSSAERHGYEDFFKRPHRYPTLTEYDDASRRASEERARQSANYLYAQQPQPSYYQTPSFAATWEQPWGATHRYDCTCSACACQHHYRQYQLSSGYPAQTAVA